MGGDFIPPLPPSPPPPRTCQGVTKQGLPCRIAWQLDALGYCKFHSQLTRACRGIAKSTGQPCRIRWDLDAHGYCKFHKSQAPTDVSPSQCVALAVSTGQRCRVTWGLDAMGYCGVHQRSSSATSSATRRPCQGLVFHTGQRCTNDAKPQYAYCCAAHDPSLPYFSPRLFDAVDKPRSLLEPQIVRRYQGRDLYHHDLLDLVTPGAVELDHIVEKQCFAFAFHGISFYEMTTDAPFLASIVRDECANTLANVCLTRTTTNKIKGAAVWKFLDDTITGHRTTMTFTEYLRNEARDGERLERTTTRVIAKEMGRALKTCQYKLADQGDTPFMDALSHQLQRVYVAMDLHSATSTFSTRLGTTARPANSTAIEDHITSEAKATLPLCKSKLVDAIHAKPFVPGQGTDKSEKNTAKKDLTACIDDIYDKKPSIDARVEKVVENSNHTSVERSRDGESQAVEPEVEAVLQDLIALLCDITEQKNECCPATNVSGEQSRYPSICLQAMS